MKNGAEVKVEAGDGKDMTDDSGLHYGDSRKEGGK